MSAPMIVLFTDFGADGPYVGQMKAVLTQQAPTIPAVDLLHSVPGFDIRAAAHLLAAYVPVFPRGSVMLCVVDPGVGDVQRRPVVMRIDGRWFVGPDNGLFAVLAARAAQVQCWQIDWRPASLSDTFHGRDLFAPVAARLARDGAVPGTRCEWPVSSAAGEDAAAIIYVDPFGNAVTGLRADNIETTARLRIGKTCLPYARTFSEVPVGEAFWYANANGLVEIAVNQGNAACTLGLRLGQAVGVS